jgi:hypothetical protein
VSINQSITHMCSSFVYPEREKDVREWDRSSGARRPRAQSSAMELERRVAVGAVAINGSGWRYCELEGGRWNFSFRR